MLKSGQKLYTNTARAGIGPGPAPALNASVGLCSCSNIGGYKFEGRGFESFSIKATYIALKNYQHLISFVEIDSHGIVLSEAVVFFDQLVRIPLKNTRCISISC